MKGQVVHVEAIAVERATSGNRQVASIPPGPSIAFTENIGPHYRFTLQQLPLTGRQLGFGGTGHWNVPQHCQEN